MSAAALNELVVEILHNRGDDTHPDWSVGSGFFVSTRLVLTAFHNVDGPGELLVRVHGKEEHPAVVRLQGDKDIVDLAVLKVSDVMVSIPPLRYGEVDRRAPSVVEQCWAVGFPRFKEREKDPKPLRLSAQVVGEIPTGENLDQPLLTLNVRRSPRPLPSRGVPNSEWAGMSGAVVFSGENIIVGVITEHHLPEGESALTVVPITSLDRLPGTEAAKWWKLLGMDRQALVRLPGDIFAAYLDRLVYEYENWSEFNDVVAGSPRQKKPMMIEKMAFSDLYREFVPLNIQYMQLWQSRWKPTSTGVITDLTTTWLTRSGSHAGASLLLILGDYGTGKSSYAIRLAYEIAKNYLAHPMKKGLIPVYVDLRDYRRFGTIETFLEKLLSDTYRLHIDTRQFKELLHSGRLLLILDGFDEMASRASVSDTLANFREIKRLSLPGVKTVLTCRTHYFRSDREVEQIVDERPLPSDNPLLDALKEHSSHVVVNLRQFSNDQIRELIHHRVAGSQVEQIWNEISRRYNLLDLARRPVLLDMILTTMPTLMARGDSINAAHVYDAYTSLWIKRDDWRSNLTAEGKSELTKRLAWLMMEMWLNRATGPDSETEEVSISVVQLLQTTGDTATRWLKSRGRSVQEDAGQLDYDMRTCSFLRRSADGGYSFSHRSFLEYFAALHLVDTADASGSPLLLHRLASYSNAVRWDLPSPEVAMFMINILKGAPAKGTKVLGLTHSLTGSGGNGVTLVAESLRNCLVEHKIGCNLRDCVAFALDLSERDLTGADFSCSALASPCLERTVLKSTKWEYAACRINRVYDAAFGSDQSILIIGSGNGTLSRWNLKNGTRLACLHLKSEYVFDMSIHEVANLWAFTTWDGWIHLRRVHDGSQVWSRFGKGAGKGKITLSYSGRYVAACSWDGCVGVWDCSAEGGEVGIWNMGGRVQCVAFDPFDQYLLAAVEGKIHLLRVGANERKLVPSKELRSVDTAAFSPDGTLVAVAGIPALTPLHIIKVSTGETVFETQDVYGHTLSFSPDGLRLAIGETIVDLSDRSRRTVESGHYREIESLQISQDGKQLVSGGLDGTVRVCDSVSGALIAVVDVGINCFGADITGAGDFGELSYQLSADWETWCSGAALGGRLRRCGAIAITEGDSKTELTRPEPCAVWNGQEYLAWQSGLKWVNRENAYRIRHGKKMSDSTSDSDFFLGAARGTPTSPQYTVSVIG
jgi:WD40 repeat protein